MTRLLTWRNEWSLHIDAVDTDHRALIAEFMDICIHFCPEATKGRSGNADALLDALTELGEHTREHFHREERFMLAFGYDGFVEHRSEHAMLMAEFTSMLRDWREQGIHVLDENRQELLRHWLLGHMLGADREFAHAYFQLFGSEFEQEISQPLRVSARQPGVSSTSEWSDS